MQDSGPSLVICLVPELAAAEEVVKEGLLLGIEVWRDGLGRAVDRDGR